MKTLTFCKWSGCRKYRSAALPALFILLGLTAILSMPLKAKAETNYIYSFLTYLSGSSIELMYGTGEDEP